MRESAPTDTDREPVSFGGTDGSRIDAWLYRPDVRPTTGTTIVMAHGIGGIKSAGLAPIAERFAAAGHTCVVFDYRHFGASEGYPREFLSIRAERDDYRQALDYARRLPETSRTVVWGCSFAGGHITRLAVDDERLAGAIAICPLVDGAWKDYSPARAVEGLDRIGATFGLPPVYVPISVPASEFGVLPARDSMAGREILAPTDGAAGPTGSPPAACWVRHSADRRGGWVVPGARYCSWCRTPTPLCRRAPRYARRNSRG